MARQSALKQILPQTAAAKLGTACSVFPFPPFPSRARLACSRDLAQLRLRFRAAAVPVKVFRQILKQKTVPAEISSGTVFFTLNFFA